MAQVIRPALLTAGFQLVSEKNLEVTDDVSIIEALGEPVKVTLGAYSNIKVKALPLHPSLQSASHLACSQSYPAEYPDALDDDDISGEADWVVGAVRSPERYTLVLWLRWYIISQHLSVACRWE